jgi:hypothetical protein
MTISRLDSVIRIPYDEKALLSDDPKRIQNYMLQLVKTLQEILTRISQISNLVIDLASGDAIYFGVKNSAGVYPDGTWRLKMVGNNLESQYLSGTTWTTAHTTERPV